MVENSSPKFPNLNGYKSKSDEDYMNIAKRNEIIDKKYDKFKPRDSEAKIQSELEGEEGKIKIMLYSLIRNKRLESQISENFELKNDEIFSPLNKIFPIKRFSELSFNFDKIKNHRKFGSKKSLIKRKNNKVLKQVVRFQINDKYSSMFDISHQRSIFKNKTKKNSSKEDSSFKTDTSFSKSALSDNIYKSKKREQRKNKKIYDSPQKKIEEILTNINNSNYPISKIGKKQMSNKIIRTNNKYYLEDKCNNHTEIKHKFYSNFGTKIIKEYKSNTIAPKTLNKYIIKQSKENLIKNITIHPEDESNIINSSGCLSHRLNNSPNHLKKCLSNSRKESKFQKTLSSRILKIEKNNNDETSSNFKSSKSTVIVERKDNDNQQQNINFNYNQKYRILFHKKIIYDSLDDDEFEEVESNNFFINPNSKFCILFDSLIFCLTLTYSITIPYYLAKNVKISKNENISFFNVLNYVSEIFNLFDIILSFFKAFYNFDEQLIKNSKLIAHNYIDSWFLTDLIESIPFYGILIVHESKYEINNKFYYLSLCIKMIKLYKIFQYNQAYKKICNYLQNSNFFAEKKELIIKIFMVLLSFHFGACIFIFFGKNSYPNWIIHLNLNLNDFNEIYISAIYSLMTTITTVGYGDVTSYSFPEKILQIILLIFGIISYSWIVSSVSNYINKINNYLVDLEEKKEILDEIKLQHPNLPTHLYNEILRYLKYKNHIEKNNKNIIFDCLPISLKNVFIYEMYKPIITKFSFFKNFDNIDFIVKVILAFRPVIAMKNDILINSEDIIEEIIFVKKGILILQLPINYENPKENISIYSNINLFKSDNNSTDKTSFENSPNNFIKLNEDSKNLTLGKLKTYENIVSFNKSSFHNDSLNNKKTLKSYYTTKNIKYIKIVNIRENEHFGDVLMFTEQRSPLRLKVLSKKAELFLLKKVDAVKISTDYRNIWRRINKRSVYNFEQMKKSIQKIIEISSLNFRAIKQNNMNISYNSTLTNKSSIISTKKMKKKLKKISTPIISINSKILNKKEDNKLKEEKEHSREIMDSEISIKNLSSSLVTDSSKEEKKDSIEPNNHAKVIHINNIRNCSIGNKVSIEKYNENKEKIKIKFKFRRNPRKKNKSCSIKINRDYNLIEDNKRFKNNTVTNYLSEDFNSNSTPFQEEEEINEEIYPNETFELNNIAYYSANFLCVKDYENFKKEESNNFFTKSSKVQMILESKIDDSDSKNEIKKNIGNNFITREINFKINSSYENFNVLSHNTYINNDILQNKLKDFFNNEISKVNISPKKFNNRLSLLSSKFYNERSSSSIKKSFISKINNIKKDKTVLDRSNKNISANIFNLPYNNRTSKEIKRQKTFDKPVLSKKHKNSKNLNNISCFVPSTTPKSSNQESSKDSGNNRASYCKSNKKGTSLLFQMNQNILNSSRNLVNPSKFYKRYFNSLMNNNKKKDLDNSINKRRRRKGLTMKCNSNEKIKEEKKRKSYKKSRKFFNI